MGKGTEHQRPLRCLLRGEHEELALQAGSPARPVVPVGLTDGTAFQRRRRNWLKKQKIGRKRQAVSHISSYFTLSNGERAS
jgi:hypothetical protein